MNIKMENELENKDIQKIIEKEEKIIFYDYLMYINMAKKKITKAEVIKKQEELFKKYKKMYVQAGEIDKEEIEKYKELGCIFYDKREKILSVMTEKEIEIDED
jgi:hypothetical protein